VGRRKGSPKKEKTEKLLMEGIVAQNRLRESKKSQLNLPGIHLSQSCPGEVRESKAHTITIVRADDQQNNIHHQNTLL
jgi:hypothetical protein